MRDVTDVDLDSDLKTSLAGLSNRIGVDIRDHVQGNAIQFETLWADIVSNFSTELLETCVTNPVFKEESRIVQMMGEAIQTELERRIVATK